MRPGFTVVALWASMTLSMAASAQQSHEARVAPVTDAAPPVMLSPTELAETRAGQTVIVNNQTLNAMVSGNVLGDYAAGDISFNDNAFANFAGIGNFTINTGAQNNLQTAMVLTINVAN